MALLKLDTTELVIKPENGSILFGSASGLLAAKGRMAHTMEPFG